MKVSHPEAYWYSEYHVVTDGEIVRPGIVANALHRKLAMHCCIYCRAFIFVLTYSV